jgi:cytochrome c oxidase cbb3-type subunit III
MNHRAILATRIMVTTLVTTLAALATTACGSRSSAPGRPPADSQVASPAKIMDFSILYAKNCAGCHGPDGKGGAAVGLGNPVYLAIADDATILRVTADGVPGTSMPAFAQHSGGMLTDDQIDAIVHGIRSLWGKPDALHDAHPPPYAVQGSGDAKRGAAVYGAYCSSCHGANGGGGKRASSIVDVSYLALVSDQNLRTTVIVGRPEMGAPDWRNDLPGKPMSPDDVSDVVAWLVAQRPKAMGLSSSLRVEGGIR